MTKNTTDELREQIQSCFKRNLMQTEGDTELFDTELTIDNLLALISNREKLARIDELEKLIADTLEPEKVGGHFIHKPVKEFVKQLKQWTNEQLATLRKELDGGQS